MNSTDRGLHIGSEPGHKPAAPRQSIGANPEKAVLTAAFIKINIKPVALDQPCGYSVSHHGYIRQIQRDNRGITIHIPQTAALYVNSMAVDRALMSLALPDIDVPAPDGIQGHVLIACDKRNGHIVRGLVACPAPVRHCIPPGRSMPGQGEFLCPAEEGDRRQGIIYIFIYRCSPAFIAVAVIDYPDLNRQDRFRDRIIPVQIFINQGA